MYEKKDILVRESESLFTNLTALEYTSRGPDITEFKRITKYLLAHVAYLWLGSKIPMSLQRSADK
tara:strand:- start:2937 stop:3131 length:195 start_codon:yes stop_codon:yes gene_type:complete